VHKRDSAEGLVGEQEFWTGQATVFANSSGPAGNRVLGGAAVDRCGPASIQNTASAAEVGRPPVRTRYSFFFTRTTVIFANPSSNTGAFNFAAIFRMMSSGTTRSLRW